MKRVQLLIPVLTLVTLLVTSCSSVKVATDYDEAVDFDQYQSFAFYKPGIDKAEISDLDKKRILRAIEVELTQKGLVKSTNPSLLVSIFTKSNTNVDIYRNNYGYGYGYGWRPYYYGGMGRETVSTSTEGTLYIDFIDAAKKELVWQGMGTGVLSQDREAKIERIKEIVLEVMKKYPPGTDKK
ncbi:DUF4136 domain-containing protein [Mesonia sp. MT50]|uniref:DUF4136 domain-containing protein n=1 Tax=Mesonia profundi TaxID=3070998 RepID=A0ABU1A3S1_9FLAO|nr:DUF4136 domain-containing protein [Mesonia profundi]MDQ7918353.1 DUF4136 domain-containing protein [Mesonia profundi]